MPRPLRLGRTRGPTTRMIAMVPSRSGTPTHAYSKKPNGGRPPFTAASETSTFTGVPVRASSEPAWPAKTIGIRSCEGGRARRTAITTTTGRSAATEPLRLMSAVSTAIRSMVSTKSRVWLSPACRIRNWPVHAVTPVASRPALTTNREAMKTTAGSPKPASDWPRSSTPVAHSASDVASATTMTGKRSQTNRTTTAATMAKVSVMSLNQFVPRLHPCHAKPLSGTASPCAYPIARFGGYSATPERQRIRPLWSRVKHTPSCASRSWVGCAGVPSRIG